MLYNEENIKLFNVYKTKNGNYRSKANNKTYYMHNCKTCGICFIGHKTQQYCSHSCSMNNNLTQEKLKKTIMDKYGVEYALQSSKIREKGNITKQYLYNDVNYVNTKKAIKTKVNRYGNQFKSIIQKMRQTKKDRYGDCNYVNRNKAENTNQIKYGGTYPLADKKIQEKSIKTIRKKYNNNSIINVFQTDHVKSIIQKHVKNNRIVRYDNLKNILNLEGYTLLNSVDDFVNGDIILKFMCPVGHIDRITTSNWYKGSRCGKCFGNRSVAELEISKWLQLLNINVVENDRSIIKPYELDVYLPEHSIAIEYNGLYWHSDCIIDKNYHLKKTELCESSGIQLIHIFENEWLFKKDIVKSVILSKLGIYDTKIYARKCDTRLISSKEKDDFLQTNHLQGKDKSSIKLGLFYNDELVSIMTFGKRKITGGTPKTELIRYCTKLNTIVIGGGSKLFSYYINRYEGNIITYADRRYSDGTFYGKLKFVFNHISPPCYYYVKGYNVTHRSMYQKHMLKNKLDIFDETLTEYENMINNGFRRIWDCGNYVFEFK